MDNDHENSTQGQNATIYTCPMHPEVRKTEPGKCPGCGMDLIPGKKDRQHGQHEGHDMQAMCPSFAKASAGTHMDHESAMTNPQMAKKMEADMRRRFWVSLLLSIPIFLLSPVGAYRHGGSASGGASLPDNFVADLLVLPHRLFLTGSIFITGTTIPQS